VRLLQRLLVLEFLKHRFASIRILQAVGVFKGKVQHHSAPHRATACHSALQVRTIQRFWRQISLRKVAIASGVIHRWETWARTERGRAAAAHARKKALLAARARAAKLRRAEPTGTARAAAEAPMPNTHLQGLSRGGGEMLHISAMAAGPADHTKSPSLSKRSSLEAPETLPASGMETPLAEQAEANAEIRERVEAEAEAEAGLTRRSSLAGSDKSLQSAHLLDESM
jgi:hypothetical protein